VGLDGVGQDKTTSILKCVEYSHSNLSESAQQLLLCLAPFSGFIYRGGIPLYAEELKKLEPFKDYDFAGFDDAIQEAINWGLLSPIDDNNDRLLSIQPVFPYFLQVRLNESTAEIQSALQDGFKNHHRSLADYYRQLMKSKDPQEKQMGIVFCRLEYENLYTALQICLQKQESINIYFCLDKYFEVTSNTQDGLKIAEEVNEALETYPVTLIQGELGHEVMIALDYLANAYLETKQFDRAKQSYQNKLEVIAALQSIDARQKGLSTAITYHNLGIVAQELREWDDARHNYHQALAIFVEFGDRYSQASTYHQLGRVAEELREWDGARHNYRQSLAIFVEFGDRYSQASTYHQLGRVAEELREWDDARHNYHQSLAIFVEFGDRYAQADTYHQLGVVAQKLREWDDARHNYHQSLAIFVEFGDRYAQADTYHQLGVVAEELKEWDDARHNYHQALAIFVEFGDRYSQAGTYYQLGRVAEEVGDSQEAINNYLQDLAITAEFNDEYGLGISMRNLARFYKSTLNPELLKSIANILEVSEADVQQQFQI
jgi:tetratricopeptide (TPR) repeat protein